MTAANSRGLRKMGRTMIQVVASGGITSVAALIAGALDHSFGPLAAAVFGTVVLFLVTYSQNSLETSGKIPTLLPTPGLVVGPVAETVATVEAVADSTGDIVGDVLSTSGDIIGGITGQTDDDHEAGGSGMIAILIIGFCILVLVGFFSVCDLAFNDEDEPNDNHLLGRIELVSHEYDDDGGYYEEGDRNGGYGSDYGGNRRDDRNRNRGAFSPGPFDDSPVDAFNGNTICLPGSTCYADDRRRDEQPNEEGER